MDKNEWGGARPKQRDDDQRGGKRKNAGRKAMLKFKSTRIPHGGHVVIERGIVNELPSPPEVWELVTVQDGFFELQRTVDGTSEIITISDLGYWNGE